MTDNQIPFADDQRLDVGAHVCAIHDDPDRVLRTLGLVFRAGLDRGERCAYAASEEAAGKVRRIMEDAGVDVSLAESGGGLMFLTDRDAILKDGNEFDPDHTLEAIKGLLGETLEAGYAGLRFSADIPWLTRNVPGAERVMEFEAKADEVINVPGVPLLALCQYNLREVAPEDTMEILERHPLTLIGGRVHVNEGYTR
ncbi:MAG: MEDS domain-containing protein [Actinomycetota bacterium]|nr:MEDS domain-containing protein [Actinomycetota bacterium]